MVNTTGPKNRIATANRTANTNRFRCRRIPRPVCFFSQPWRNRSVWMNNRTIGRFIRFPHRWTWPVRRPRRVCRRPRRWSLAFLNRSISLRCIERISRRRIFCSISTITLSRTDRRMSETNISVNRTPHHLPKQRERVTCSAGESSSLPLARSVLEVR